MRRPRISRVAVLAGVGAFLLTFAALLRFFVYEGVLALPLQHNRTYRLESPVSTFLDTGTLVSYDRVPLVSTTTLSGDAAAGDGNVAVWTEFTTLDTPFGERVAYHERRTAFDRRTGLAVDCCDGYVDDDPGARQTGLAFRLPFRAQPRVYPMYDTVLRRPVPLLFEREEEVRGLRTYRYAYRTGFIKIEDLPGKLPGRLLGLPGTRSVAVARYAQVSRTLWVEPESGLTVRAQEQHRQELRTSDGRAAGEPPGGPGDTGLGGRGHGGRGPCLHPVGSRRPRRAARLPLRGRPGVPAPGRAAARTPAPDLLHPRPRA